MIDGVYDLQLMVDDYCGAGTLVFDGKHGHGFDRTFQIELHLIRGGHQACGIVNVLLRPEEAAQLAMPLHYSLTMEGSAGEDTINLIGRGPGGQLVEVCADRPVARPDRTSPS